MGTLLVGIDGSPSAADALGWSADAAKVLGLDLLLVAAVPDLERREQVLACLAGDWGAPARRRGVDYGSDAVHGDARSVLLAAARDPDVELLAVGAGRPGWFPALHLGSTSHYLAHYTPVPTAVIPSERPEFGTARIVVGLDGSDDASRAAAWAVGFAKVTGATVVASFGWQPPASPLEQFLPATVGNEAEAEDLLEEWAAPLRTSGVEVEVHVGRGDVAHVLAVAAAEADLLVLGARGAGKLHDLQLGSTSLKVLHVHALPVLLVPPVRRR